MNATAWLDQRAAGIRTNREGQPITRNITSRADLLAKQLPDLTRESLGAVLITWGAVLADAWTQLEEVGAPPVEILESLVALTDVVGEHLYAPEGGRSA